MKHARWFRAIGLAVIASMVSLASAAQAGDPTDLLLRRLNEQFIPTVFNQGETEIVTAGGIVALQKDGLLVFRNPVRYCPITTYKNGKFSQGFFDQMEVAGGDKLGDAGGTGAELQNGFRSYPQKILGFGEKVWIQGFGFGKNTILAVVVTDPYDDGRYCGMLKFPYEKGHLPTPDEAVRMISEVLAVAPVGDQGGRPAPTDASAPASNPEQVAQQGPVSGKYMLMNAGPGTGAELTILSNTSCTVHRRAGQEPCEYQVSGDTLTVTFALKKKPWSFSIQPDRLTEPSQAIWLRVGGAPAPAPETPGEPQVAGPSLDQVAGLYVMAKAAKDAQLQLNSDGTYLLVLLGKNSSGTFTVDANKLIIHSAWVRGPTLAFTIQGDTLIDPNGYALVKQGAATRVVVPTVAPLHLPSTYVNAQTPTDRIQLNADNSFTLQEAGQSYQGTFVASGNTVELNISGGTKTTATIQGNALTDSGGQKWVLREQAAGTASAGPMLKNEDIVKMAKAGLDDALIIAKIGSSKCQFDTSTDALIQLKQSGVSPAVLKAIMGAGK